MKTIKESFQFVFDAADKERQDILSKGELSDDDLVRLAQIEKLLESFGENA